MTGAPRSAAGALAGVAPADLRLPPAPPGSRIGLLGGSFDPPHAGHLLVARAAIRRLRLDRLWWMVTPGNPLKDHGHLAPLERRIAASRALARHPRIVVTGFEAAFHIRYTADTIGLVRQRRPGAHFVWIMGADSLATFHRWQSFAEIARAVPIAVVDRPGATLSPLSAPAARRFAKARLRERDAARLPARPPPAWVFLHGARSPISSTLLRSSRQPPS